MSFWEKTFCCDIKHENISNKKLVKELHEPITKNFNKVKLYSSFIDNICGEALCSWYVNSMKDLDFYYVLLIFVVNMPGLFKDKKGITITNAFQKILDESKRKTNKIWEDKGSEFDNRSVKWWIEKNDKEIYSTHNEGKSVVSERFIRTYKIYKYNTSVSKNVYNKCLYKCL